MVDGQWKRTLKSLRWATSGQNYCVSSSVYMRQGRAQLFLRIVTAARFCVRGQGRVKRSSMKSERGCPCGMCCGYHFALTRTAQKFFFKTAIGDETPRAPHAPHPTTIATSNMCSHHTRLFLLTFTSCTSKFCLQNNEVMRLFTDTYTR